MTAMHNEISSVALKSMGHPEELAHVPSNFFRNKSKPDSSGPS